MFVSKRWKHRKHLVPCVCSALSALNMEFEHHSHKNDFHPLKFLAEHTVFISQFHSEILKCVPMGRVGWRLGRVNGKVLDSMTTVRLCVYIYVPRLLPLWAHRPMTGNWLQTALTEWFPSGTTCQVTSLPATLSYIPQQCVRCQLSQSGWMPPSASLAATDTWTSTGVEEKERETWIVGRVDGGSESYVK